MATGASTFTDVGGAVADLFAGLGAATSSQLKAQGLDIEAMGTDISAQSLQVKAAGDLAEAQEYGLAGALASQNAAFTDVSTKIQLAQQDRQTTMTIGSQKAAVGGGGLAESGSALDVLRESASQGALAKSVLASQGQITEAGFNEQAASYDLMQTTAQTTATAEQQMSTEEQNIATQQRQLASETAAAGTTAEIGDFLAGAVKGVAAIATLAA